MAPIPIQVSAESSVVHNLNHYIFASMLLVSSLVVPSNAQVPTVEVNDFKSIDFYVSSLCCGDGQQDIVKCVLQKMRILGRKLLHVGWPHG